MAETTLDDIARRLDLLLGTIQLAHASSITAARETLLADKVTLAVYESTLDWIAAGTLATDVAASVGVTTRTVRSRVAELVAQHVLEMSGTSTSTKYRRTGLL